MSNEKDQSTETLIVHGSKGKVTVEFGKGLNAEWVEQRAPDGSVLRHGFAINDDPDES